MKNPKNMSQTEFRKNYSGSDWFQYKNDSSIDAEGTRVIDFRSERQAKNYLPFDTIEISNNSNQDINVHLNQDEDSIIFVQSNGSKSFDYNALRSVLIENLDSSNSIDAEKIVVQARARPIDPSKKLVREARKSRGV